MAIGRRSRKLSPFFAVASVFLVGLAAGGTNGNVTMAAPGASWSCMCAAGAQGGAPESNCTSNCNCTSDGKSGWRCSCSPASSSPGRDENCFASCDCSSAAPAPAAAKNDASKSLLIALLVFVVIAAGAFLAFVVYFFTRSRDKLSSQSRIHSLDKFSSCNSRLNLISTRSLPTSTSSVSDTHGKATLSSAIGAFREFVRWLSVSDSGGAVPGAIVRFSYAELEQATNKFSADKMVGVGATCRVYRGQLADGRVVAIKKHRQHGGADADAEFLSEIELLSRLNHFHVVPLLGYCSEQQGKSFERLLVFEFMPNGDLRSCLNADAAKPAMDWATRVKIALGAARGLEYLHEAAAPRILHRDIKSTNILLDDTFRAKITDLGMAKRLSAEDAASGPSSPARMLGTFGYFAPEYAIVGKASLKSDVFSFGVVLLELITGRQPIHTLPNKNDESLVIWATPRLRDSRLVVTELPDPALQGKFPLEEMQIMAHLARECLQWEPEARPTMTEIVQILTTIAPATKPRRKLYSTFSPVISQDYIPRAAPRDALQASSERWNPRSPMAPERYNMFDGRRSMEAMPPITAATPAADAGRRRVEAGDDLAVHLTEPRLERFAPPADRRRRDGAAGGSFDLREPRLETFRQADGPA